MPLYLLFMVRSGFQGLDTRTVFERGALDYLGSLNLARGQEARLPQDPRYLVVDPQTGAISKYFTHEGRHLALDRLGEIAFGPAVTAVQLRDGVWLECERPRERTGTPARIGSAGRTEAGAFAEPYRPVARDFQRRIAEGKRCYFTETSASQVLLCALSDAMADPSLSLSDLFPGVRVCADQDRPPFADVA